jgi:hypothetical protein
VDGALPSQGRNDYEIKALEVKALELQYAQVSLLMHTFLEWRHKIMTRYAISVGGLGLAIKLVSGLTKHVKYQLIPMAAGAILSLLAAALDHVHQRILWETYQVGEEIESELNRVAGTRLSALTLFPRLQLLFRPTITPSDLLCPKDPTSARQPHKGPPTYKNSSCLTPEKPNYPDRGWILRLFRDRYGEIFTYRYLLQVFYLGATVAWLAGFVWVLCR